MILSARGRRRSGPIREDRIIEDGIILERAVGTTKETKDTKKRGLRPCRHSPSKRTPSFADPFLLSYYHPAEVSQVAEILWRLHQAQRREVPKRSWGDDLCAPSRLCGECRSDRDFGCGFAAPTISWFGTLDLESFFSIGLVWPTGLLGKSESQIPLAMLWNLNLLQVPCALRTTLARSWRSEPETRSGTRTTPTTDLSLALPPAQLSMRACRERLCHRRAVTPSSAPRTARDRGGSGAGLPPRC